MNYRKINRRILILLIFLLVALLATSVLLGFRLSEITNKEQNVIVIVPNTADEDEKEKLPSIITYDDNGIWSSKTDIEIFKMEYHNDGYITVQSSNGDKVVAPGTENEYTFHFKNEGNAPGKYNMKLEAIFSQKDWPIPIEARMKNQNGEYILGSKDSWDNSPDLKEIKDSAVLGTNKFATYTFEWRWPFERGDGDELIANNEYDTFIADFESLYSKEMTLNISTSTELDYGVENSTDKVQGISSPYTGEMRNLAIRSAIVMLVLVTSIISIIHLERRQIKKIEALATKTAVNDTERENE